MPILLKRPSKVLLITMLSGLLLTAGIPPASSEAKERTQSLMATEPRSAKPTEDEAEQKKLILLVERLTDLANKNRLNVDFVPGMVTVLDGRDLEALGIRTVWEALSLVPGIDISLERQGFTQTIVRGSVTVFSLLHLKILLDKVPLKTEIGLCPVLKMPVEQIERIEIIRGPGSAIHGEFALMGVVNIITRKKSNQLFSTIGSFNTYEYGGIFSWSDPKGDFHLNLNLAGWDTDGADIQTGPDTLYGMGMDQISNAPGSTNEKEAYEAGFLNLDYRKFSLSVRWIGIGQGDFFGIGNALPPPADHIIFREKQWGMTITQGFAFSSLLQADFTLGFHEQHFEGNDGYWYPPGFAGLYPEGWTYDFNYMERLFHSGLDLIWKGLDKHTVLLGGSFSRTEFLDAWLRTNIDWSSGFPPLPSDQPVIEYADEERREIGSIILQDEFQIFKSCTFTSGLRYDHYNDLGERFSPRIAAVYRLSRHHILKTQYAQAFRPPSFFEMYAPTNPIILSTLDLKPEIIDAYELGYIYKGTDTIWRLTTFYSEFRERIYEDTALRVYRNSTDDYHSKGAEIELEKLLSPLLKCDANLSYIKMEDEVSTQQNARGADWLANLSLIFHPKKNFTLTSHYRYVGQRQREPLDPRDDMKEYHTVDITGMVLNFGFKGMALSSGVKNLFDEDVRYPSPLERYWPMAPPHPSYIS